jgi:16S rRNA (adenine1518-N6/adenine1519-N6)-dimethyltransferase
MTSHRSPRRSSSQPTTTQAPRNLLLEEARRLRLKKRFSQHFLVNATVLDRIAGLMDLDPEDTVVEIGPGAGFLTERLLERAGTVIAVELDRNMCEYLRKKFAGRANFQLIEQDILRFDFDAIETPRFKVVGNLPYAITSKIMFKLAGELDMVHYPLRQRIEQLTVMVQKEVGERITAKPGQRAFNPLSIALQFWFAPRFDFEVPARDFCPPPKVESAVVSLFPRSAPLAEVRDMAVFGRLVRTSFAQKRKTIRNALLNGAFANADVLDKIFGATGINSSLRAEALPVEAFGELANALCPDPGQD